MRTLIFMAFVAAAVGCVRTVALPPLQNVAVRGFVAHAEREWPGSPEQQELTADTFDWLATAMESLATTRQLEVADLSGRMQQLRADLKEFSGGEAGRAEQTAVLRKLFSSGADLLSDVARASGMEGKVRGGLSNVRRAAESLDDSRPPSEQAEVIEKYFREASDVLQRLDRGA
jgi:hypothetical protein